MHRNIKIEGMDYFGRGISHINGKVVFVYNAIPGEVVDIEVTRAKKDYSEAKVVKYIKQSPERIKSECPYFNECGGCNLLFYSYQHTLDFKLNEVRELIRKNNISYDRDIEVIKNIKSFNYRNKVSLKIAKGKIGYFKDRTHELVKIRECRVALTPINKVIKNFKLLNIDEGTLTIRSNYNDEVLLIINSNHKTYEIELEKLKQVVKLVGIVYNDKTIYGNNFFYERIGGMLFKVSYNSFFQVNHNITKELFKLVDDNIKDDEVVLDLYCGVGTLGLVASRKAREVISGEIVPNAVLNGIHNAKLNKKDNIKFMLGDAGTIVSKLNKKVDTLIIDPPRKGLDKESREFILKSKPPKIIYISCDIATLMRDLKSIEEYYKIQEYKILDMFSYSYHLESFVVLERK